MTSLRSAFSPRTLLAASLLGVTLLVAGTAAIIAQVGKPARTPAPATPVPANPAPAAPVLSDTLKLHFFRAQAEMQTAQTQVKEASTIAETKQAALQAAVAEITKACGKAAQPTIDKSGDVVCEAKPTSAAAVHSAGSTSQTPEKK